ncbi:MAG: hypothetical protein QXV60_04150, partial [Nitrososphaerota archaeon]
LPTGTGVGDRYNVTNAFVELYTEMPAVSEELILLGTFRTNGTGFVQIKWPTVYAGYEVTNFTLWVHWKDTEIYIYELYVGEEYTANASRLWDNSLVTWLTWPHGYETAIGDAMGVVDLTSFATVFSSPDKAFVAHAAIIFKDIETLDRNGDPLGNTVIRVYENSITDQASTESMIYGGTADENGLLESVPIPLNITTYDVGAPYLNGSIAVWWETVLVGFENHTIGALGPFDYTYNGTTDTIYCNVDISDWYVYDSAYYTQPLWGARIKINVLGVDVAGTPVNYAIDKWFLTDYVGYAEVFLPNATDGLRYCYSPVDITVIDTASFADDVKFLGLGIEVEWKGGIKNAYGGTWVLVNYTFLNATDPALIPSNFWDTTVYVSASVYDVAFQVVDALGVPVDGALVTLIRQNGPPITKTSGKITDFDLDQDYWTYESGFVFFHQLPGKLLGYGTFPAVYGVKVVYEGVEVYYNATILKPLNSSVNDLPTAYVDNWAYGGKYIPYIVLNASIFKVKVHLADCNFNGLPYVTVNYTHPTYGAVVDSSDGDGNIDLVAVPGTYKFTAVYFKGIWASVVKGNDTITVSKNINLAVNVKFNIADIILTFYDADKEVTIPNLNATLSWIGTLPDGTKAVFEEKTLNGTLVDGTPYRVYRDDTRTKVIFKQMPSAVYNITVTTKVADGSGKELTPGKAYWPNKRLVYFEAFKSITIDCSNVNLDILTWAYDWTLKVVNSFVPLANVTVYVYNDENRLMGTWVTDATGVLKFDVEQANFKTDTTTAYTTKRIWWNGTYRIEIEYKAAWDYLITKVYNASVSPDQIADNHTFVLKKNEQEELLKVPVGDIIVKATDKCGKPLFGKFDNATVELVIERVTDEPARQYIVYETVKVNETGHAVWLHVPTAGWFNATQMMKDPVTGEKLEWIKGFRLRILWYNNSAVVFEKYWNMTKEGFKGGESEVYNITFVTAICKDVNRAVKNLNVTLWWTNATNPTQKVYPKWWNGTAWITDPAEGKMPWKEGKWTFVMVPGPKYFNVSDAYYHVHVYNDAFEDTGITELAYPGPMGTELSYL